MRPLVPVLFLLSAGVAACDPNIGPDPSDGSSSTGAGPHGKQGYEQGSRLKVKALVGADGSQQRIGFSDTMRNNEACSFRRASDGTWRCMPDASTTISAYYSDPSCTSPVAVGSCSTPADAYASEVTVDACGAATYHLYQRGAQIVGQVYALQGSCVNATINVPAFVVDGEIAPDAFVSAVEQLVP